MLKSHKNLFVAFHVLGAKIIQYKKQFDIEQEKIPEQRN